MEYKLEEILKLMGGIRGIAKSQAVIKDIMIKNNSDEVRIQDEDEEINLEGLFEDNS